MPRIMARIKDYVEVINTLNTYESNVLSFFTFISRILSKSHENWPKNNKILNIDFQSQCDALLHGLTCYKDQCETPTCQEAKRYIEHVKECDVSYFLPIFSESKNIFQNIIEYESFDRKRSKNCIK